MLKYKKITIKNFLPYINEEFVFPEEDGVTIVWGKNGYGKSSMMHALKFVLFGTLPEMGSNPILSIINKHAIARNDYSISVVLDIEYDEKEYSISRIIQPKNKGVIPIDDNDFSESFFVDRTNPSQGIMSKEDANSFINVIMPKDISRFFLFDAALMSEYRELVLTRTGQTDKIKKAVEQILGLPTLVNGYVDLERIRDNYQNEVVRQNTTDDNINKQKSAVKQLEVEIERIEADTAESNREIEELNSEIAVLHQKITHHSDLKVYLARQKELDKNPNSARAK